MKKVLLIIALAIALGMNAVSAYAYSDNKFSRIQTQQIDGFYTVIYDTEGERHTTNGIINAKAIETEGWAERIASYEIYSNDECIISVTLNDISSQVRTELFSNNSQSVLNGYYSIKFTLTESGNTEAYLTGLSDSNLNLVQEKLINAKIENSSFSMESLDFIDTEKTNMPNDGDDMLCWAASAANMLHYTGWGQKAGFDSPDDIFDEFVSAFDDNGSQQVFGFNWFFNGLNDMQGADGWAQVKNYGNSGMFLPKYSVWNHADFINVSQNHEAIIRVFDELEQGNGMGISFGWLDENGVRNGGHAITLWGYIIDHDFAETDSRHYKAIIVSDSDFDMPSDPNRRVAPNKLCVLNMVPYQQHGYDSWYFEGYNGGNSGTLEAFTSLEPYSNGITYETDPDASCNKFNNFDFAVNSVYVSNDALDNDVQSKSFVTGDTIYVTPIFVNNSAIDLEEDSKFSYSIKVIEKSTQTGKFDQTHFYSGGINKYNISEKAKITKTRIPLTELEKYPPGDYTIEIEVKKNKDLPEAYYYNNKYTYDFTITNASYDPTDVTLTAGIGEIKNGEAEVTLSYEGIDSIASVLQREDATATLLQSYCIDGEWSSWGKVYTGDTPAVGELRLSKGSLPHRCMIYPDGEKVKFKLMIETSDDTIPMINIYSDELALQYSKLGIALDEANTSECTPVTYDKKSLVDSEQIAFKVKNISTYDSGKALTCNAVVYAVNDNEKVEVHRRNGITVAYGNESDTIRFHTWSPELSGTYGIVVELESDYSSGEFFVSTLAVGEAPSYIVTTENDIVDAYDSKISLREAVANIKYSGTENSAITFAEGMEFIFLKEPIVIEENKVKIDGKGIILYGSGKTQLFRVENSGKLRCNMVTLNNGYSKQSGGAIENNGGTVYLENSRVIYNNSGVSGGGIYANGGTVTLKNCSFKQNVSGYGGALATNNGAEVNIINCNIFQNKSNGGAIYNNSGHICITYSTIADNFISTNPSDNGGGITSLGKTDVFGSIITYNDGFDMSGNVHVYGSFMTQTDDNVQVDDGMYGYGEQIFMLDENTLLSWESVDTDEILSYKVNLSAMIENGIYVKNLNEKMAYSVDGNEWIQTDIPSVFTDEEYSHDIFGNQHGGLFGSNSDVCSDIKIVCAIDNTLLVYLPSPQKAVLIDKRETKEHQLSGISICEHDFDYGTNIIQIEDYDGADTQSFMLWNSIIDMKPLCEVYTKNELRWK